MEDKRNQSQASEEVEEKETVEVLDAADDNLESQQENEDTSKLEKELEELHKEKEDLFNRLLRIQAEYDNFKKRSQKEKEAERKYKAQDIVTDLLPVLDNFERALQALQVEKTEATSNLIEGISMVYRQLQDALKSNGVETIETEDKEFDPNIHHAVMQVEDDNFETNHIVEELQKGYMLKDRVIRPAMVKVNK